MSKVVVIDFMAAWCGPCKMQDPIMEELKEKFKNDTNVEFKKIDVDKAMAEGVSNVGGPSTDSKLVDKYAIHAVPTLVIEKDNDLFKKYVGFTSLNVLEKKIKEALK